MVHIFTLLLAHFMPKLVKYSRHSEPLNYVLKSTISCLSRKMSSILKIFRMFKDSLCCATNNWPMWTQKVRNNVDVNFLLTCCLWRVSCQIIVHAYVMHRMLYLNGIVVQSPFKKVAFLYEVICPLFWYVINSQILQNIDPVYR